MSVYLNLERDIAGNTAYAPLPSTDGWSATITNGAETHITVPSNHTYWVVSLSYQPGTNIWVDFSGGTAIVPVGATLAATTSRLNPGPRTVAAGSKISIITDNATADVGIEMYAVSYP